MIRSESFKPRICVELSTQATRLEQHATAVEEERIPPNTYLRSRTPDPRWSPEEKLRTRLESAHVCPKVLSGRENRDFVRGDIHGIARFWISSNARHSVFHMEAAEASYFDAVTCHKCLGHRTKNGVNGALDMGCSPSHVLGRNIFN